MSNFPVANFHKLNTLDIDMNNQVIDFNPVLLDRLNCNTLTAIRNAFDRAALIWINGMCYLEAREIKHLLRTGNSGAHNIYIQQGIQGYVSSSETYNIDNKAYISGPDFSGILDARINSTFGKTHLYLRYVRSLYQAIMSSSVVGDLRVSFMSEINDKRSELKSRRILLKGIRSCEFSGRVFSSESEVQFAHVESVTSSPLQALNIENGVIILMSIHAELTRLGIHDFAGMYDFCINNSYSTVWADNYNL
ncbi:hypothetical protein [Providencia sp. PROV147]|uniref:hypothetical protein n=1 Tax=Providencia sp. PROV147 TaxID=2949857 RepID=UPI002349A9A7|nr:hypothetical protein [Providencia sp. PROV147]